MNYPVRIRVKFQYLIIVIVLVLGAGIWFYFRNIKTAGNVNIATESCDKNFKWVNPNLKCHDPVINKAAYLVFENMLEDKIKIMKEEGRVEEVSIFFRDLENGPTFGVNENNNFIGASLFKTPVMLTYFKLAENDLGLLLKTLSYNGQSQNLFNQDFAPTRLIEPDRPYTVDDLIFRMIAYSDNRAYFLLIGYLDKLSPDVDLVTETYRELGMVAENDTIDVADLSVRTYASIFRILYNMSYLSDEFSEKALDYLSHSDFTNGLRRGIPEDIRIAHKFGERELGVSDKQLHDCGIVYYPGNPYLLCIMTKGRNMQDLSDIIGTISGEVYREVDSRRF